MISMHTSPLATPGVGDAGGLNVYVAEVARRLGERGLEVDVFTRAESADGPPGDRDQRAHPRDRDPRRPPEPVAKEVLPGLLEEFGRQLDLRMDDYDLIHSHYWLSGRSGWGSSGGTTLPLVHTMHTMARVKNAALGAGQQSEPDVRERGEAAIVEARRHRDRQHHR